MITWRPYRREDHETLQARHELQCAALGAVFPFPDLNDPHYLMTVVAERDGEIAGAVAAHSTVELTFLGADAGVLRAAVRDQRHLRRELLRHGAIEAHALVPRRLAARMEPILKRFGFDRSHDLYLAFYREL